MQKLEHLITGISHHREYPNRDKSNGKTRFGKIPAEKTLIDPALRTLCIRYMYMYIYCSDNYEKNSASCYRTKRCLVLQIDLLVRHHVTHVTCSSPDSTVDTFIVMASSLGNAPGHHSRWSYIGIVQVTMNVYYGFHTFH